MASERENTVRSVWTTSEHSWHYEWWTGKEWTHHETRCNFFTWDDACAIVDAQRGQQAFSSKRSCIQALRVY